MNHQTISLLTTIDTITTVTWHSRGYLPHYSEALLPQLITFRLENSLPVELLRRWQAELAYLGDQQAQLIRRKRIEQYLDKGLGVTWLSNREIAEVVENALLFFDGQRYQLHAWVVMPNHVHVVVTPGASEESWKIVHSWKSFTAKKANAILNRTGTFWQKEYFDRFVRNEEHFQKAIEYTEMNPVKAALCDRPEHWRFSSAYWRVRK